MLISKIILAHFFAIVYSQFIHIMLKEFVGSRKLLKGRSQNRKILEARSRCRTF